MNVIHRLMFTALSSNQGGAEERLDFSPLSFPSNMQQPSFFMDLERFSRWFFPESTSQRGVILLYPSLIYGPAVKLAPAGTINHPSCSQKHTTLHGSRCWNISSPDAEAGTEGCRVEEKREGEEGRGAAD